MRVPVVAVTALALGLTTTRVKKLAKLLLSPEVRRFIQDEYSGSVLPTTCG